MSVSPDTIYGFGSNAVLHERETLGIEAVGFEREENWDLKWIIGGAVVPMTMNDSEFWGKMLQQRVCFRCGDRIIADVVIDGNGKPWVMKIHEHFNYREVDEERTDGYSPTEK